MTTVVVTIPKKAGSGQRTPKPINEVKPKPVIPAFFIVVVYGSATSTALTTTASFFLASSYGKGFGFGQSFAPS